MTAGTRVALACGPLTAVFEDGDLFDVRWHGVEVAQRLYVAVRDEVWNTIPARLENLAVSTAPAGDAVRVTFDATHRYGSIAYAWQAEIDLDAGGTVVYRMRGQALGTFDYCKIGFNVHHGLRTNAGRPFRCRTVAGEHAGVFGADLVPQLVRDGTLTAMTPPYDRLEIDLDDVAVRFDFEGDRFELQDHRNWIDANWKSYGTPMELGFPLAITEGEERFQQVTITMRGTPGAAPAVTSGSDEADGVVAVRWVDADAGRLPRIGHLLSGTPTPAQVAELRTLRPAHLRVDLPTGEGAVAALAAAAALAGELGAALEVAVFVRPEDPAADARTAARALAEVAGTGRGVRVDRVIVLARTSGFSALRGACPSAAGEAVRAALAEHGVLVPSVVSGTGQYFADINRDRPDYSAIDGIVFAANPQVHAADDRSMMQNAEGIVEVVDFARRLYGEIDVVLSPVDLVGANGPFPAGPAAADGPPANEDPRQATGFAAAWTVAALSAAARSRATAVTVYELAGARGLVDEAGRLLPAAAVLAQVAALADRPLLAVRSAEPDRLAVLAFDGPAGRTVLLANLTDAPLAARLPGGELLALAPYVVASRTHGVTTVVA